jgi:hypothetical protein
LVGRGGVGQGARDGVATDYRYGPIEAWIIDDTSFPKQGRHSVGVAHQYCGQLGKQANCQVAVSLSLANHDASLPVAYRLYLPKVWAEDRNRRGKAGVPEEITFKTKLEIALDQIRWACEAGLPGNMVLVDAGYGHDSKLRGGITELGKRYVAGIQPQTPLWALRTRLGPAAKKRRRDAANAISVKELALRLRAKAWHDQVAGGHQRMAILAICTCACERCIQYPTCREARKAGAADRVARGRGCADQILALDTSEKHIVAGRCRQAELHRRYHKMLTALPMLRRLNRPTSAPSYAGNWVMTE